MKHLIKRKDLGYTITQGWRCEVKLGSSPSGFKAQKNDIVFVAQNGYAIFAKAVITKIKPIVTLIGLSDFVKYSQQTSKVKDDAFWLSKIKHYSNKKEPFKVFVLEYYLSEIEQFEFCIPLETRFLKQSAWYYLEDDFELKLPKNKTNLTAHIPTKIREEVFHQFKIQSNEHIIDIDHFIPRSLGGPGNIIENLIPISPSINRRKSNHVPSKLFDLGEKFNIPVFSYLNVEHSKFYSKPSELALAKKIIEKINTQSIEKIRADYLLIRRFHFPSS